MIVRVDAESAVPPFEQVRAQLESQVRGGQLVAGERLPTVRQLAGDLGIAAGTVQSAYRALEALGLIITRRAGTIVAAGQVADPDMIIAARSLAHAAQDKGLDLERAIAVLRSTWNQS